MKKKKCVDIVEVKTLIQAGILYVQAKPEGIFLGNYQTGEAVKISDIGIKSE